MGSENTDPFENVGVVIHVNFVIINGHIPTLMSLWDLMINNLDISIKRCAITLAGSLKKMTMENFFLVYNWKAKDLSYALYTEGELRTIHRSFGYPSVKPTTNLLR